MFKLGLTGGIGSGKTKVADMLAELGATVIDTDAISHALTARGGLAITPIRAAFGGRAIDATGALDRDYMRALVFDDPNLRARLESILHPMIAQEVERQAKQAKGCYVVFVVPLLVESGRWADRLDRVCVVDCERQTQIERVQARSGLSLERIGQILDAQASPEQRLAAADDVIDNGARISLDELRAQVLGLHQRWCNLAG
ncbi:MAG: dephospho-CoA kinase [Burkholderiaceae bacterium]|nr:dephospho-CoA kinase [Burkholderiaceae bacterium]MCD8517832.1 dephospho-CoA kinase [Burkholderiaceae bacterium]MCD8537166.1 dephospho-CoA kinase [Burkholderiaceae bacterium]MCD8564627.1 dephospho-CoA kinase [Burkholderiaceae bacterium]